MSDWSDAERHIERAHELFEARRWSEAESELRRALSIDPSRADWHFNLGVTLEAAGKPDQAVAAFRAASELDPDNAQAQMALGLNYLRLDQPKRAVEALSLAQSLAPTKPDPLVSLIEAHARCGDHEQAELAFYMAMQLDHVDEALAYCNLGSSLQARGQLERAIWCLREAAQIDSELPRVHQQLAQAYVTTGRQDRARQLYLRELRNNPGDVDTLLDLGCLLLDMNRLAEAGEKFRRVLELESDNSDAHFYLGELALKHRRLPEAISAFRLAIRLDPDHPGARRRAAHVSLQMGRLDDAKALIRQEARRFDPFGDINEQNAIELADLMLETDQAGLLLTVFERVVERTPNDAQLLHRLGLACFREGRTVEGIGVSRRAFRIEPTLFSAAYNLALAYTQQKRWRRAECWLRKASRISEDDSSLRRLSARIAAEQFWIRVRKRIPKKLLSRGARR